MRIYDWLISGLWLIFLAYWIISATSAKKNAVRTRRGMGVRMLVFLIVVALLASHAFDRFNSYYAAVSSNLFIDWAGVVLCALGIACALWARMHLGRNWGMPMSVKVDSELVTSGPYAYVRHPIYSGVLLAMFGTALTVGWWWLLLFVFFGAYFIYSATQEEKRMMREFPSQYPEYKKRTNMIVPFVF